VKIRLVVKLLREEDAVTAIEYGMLAGLIAVLLIGALTSIGENRNAVFFYLATKVDPPAG
jgi:pilus assembly protein Flp/PilA